MTAPLVIASAILGLVVGSFVNVLAWRIPRGESVVRPRSACPKCGHEIRPYDNVPVLSWLVLKGRCRDCQAPISVRYPIIEATTGVVFGLLAWRIGVDAALPAYLYLGAVGMALAVIDLEHQRLPDVLTLPSYPVAAAMLGVAALVDGTPEAWLKALAGGAALFAFYFLLVLVYPKGMGFGDVKLAGLLGGYLGYLGWDVLGVGAFAGFLLGGLAGLGLIVARKATRKSALPFGPFMLAGALVGILVGDALATAYVRLLT